MAVESQHLVNRIVVEAADPRGSSAGGFGFEVENLTDEAGFPVEAAVCRTATLLERRVEVGDHPQAEESVGSDVLIATEPAREVPTIAAREISKQSNSRSMS